MAVEAGWEEPSRQESDAFGASGWARGLNRLGDAGLASPRRLWGAGGAEFEPPPRTPPPRSATAFLARLGFVAFTRPASVCAPENVEPGRQFLGSRCQWATTPVPRVPRAPETPPRPSSPSGPRDPPSPQEPRVIRASRSPRDPKPREPGRPVRTCPADPSDLLPGGPSAGRGRRATRKPCLGSQGAPGSDAPSTEVPPAPAEVPPASLLSLVADRRHGALQLQEDHGGAVREGRRPRARPLSPLPCRVARKGRACNSGTGQGRLLRRAPLLKPRPL